MTGLAKKDPKTGFPTESDWSAEFLWLWEGEITGQDEAGDCDDGVLCFWEGAITAACDDGALPESARGWDPPPWLVKLDNGRTSFSVVRLPRKFFDDHEGRELDTPERIRQTKRHVWASVYDQHMPELRSDADHYATAGGFDPCYRGLIASARATVRAIDGGAS